MATMISEVYDALLDAGASEEKARRAAETLANYDNEFHRIDQHLSALDVRLEQRFSEIETRMEQRFSEIETRMEQRFSGVDARFNAVDVRFGQIDGRMRLLQWQVGALFALFAATTVPTLWLVLRVAAKIGALPA